jgi:aryl-alcohol dehydrogenase-like predicted oxidoreductase
MKYRTLGRTELNVSEIGFGAWGIGKHLWVGAQDDLSLRALEVARDAGINFFDTALAYGDGHSEQILAKAFGRRTDVVIATKVPPKNLIWPARPGSTLHEVFPREYVMDCVERSLRNLNRDSIDLYQFHVWNDDWTDDHEWRETVDRLRRSGKVKFIGISINDHQPANALKALATGLVDTVQVIYNIFDQSPEDELFPYCQQHNIGVIARVPFDEGSLTGKITPATEFPAGDFRNEYFSGDRKQQVWERIQRLVDDIHVPAEQLPEIALRYCISHPAVSTVIPGIRTIAHANANAAVSSRGPLPAAMVERLHLHRWVRNFYPED